MGLPQGLELIKPPAGLELINDEQGNVPEGLELIKPPEGLEIVQDSPIGAPIDFTNSDTWLKKQIETAPGVESLLAEDRKGEEEERVLKQQAYETAQQMDWQKLQRNLPTALGPEKQKQTPFTIASTLGGSAIQGATNTFDILALTPTHISAGVLDWISKTPKEKTWTAYDMGNLLLSVNKAMEEKKLPGDVWYEDTGRPKRGGFVDFLIQNATNWGLDPVFVGSLGIGANWKALTKADWINRDLRILETINKNSTIPQEVKNAVLEKYQVWAKGEYDKVMAPLRATAEKEMPAEFAQVTLRPEQPIVKIPKTELPVGGVAPEVLKPIETATFGKGGIKAPEPAPLALPAPTYARNDFGSIMVKDNGIFTSVNQKTSKEEVVGTIADLNKDTKKGLFDAREKYEEAVSEDKSTVAKNKALEEYKIALNKAKIEVVEKRFGPTLAEKPVEKDVTGMVKSFEDDVLKTYDSGDVQTAEDKITKFITDNWTDLVSPEQKTALAQFDRQYMANKLLEHKQQVANDVLSMIRKNGKINIESVKKGFDYDLLDPRIKRYAFTKKGGTSLDEMAQTLEVSGGSNELWQAISGIDMNERAGMNIVNDSNVEEKIIQNLIEKEKSKLFEKWMTKLETSKPVEPAITEVSPITEKQKLESGKIVDQGVIEGMTRAEIGNIPTGKIEGTPKEDIDAIMAEIKSGELVGARQGNMDYGENEGNGPKYSMGKEGYTAPEGAQTAGTIKKVIPPVSATGKPIGFEKSVPWEPGRGRNITEIFQREIGPELQVSTRMKRWLGAYYNVMPSGLIRIRSIADADTLNHETGHFLDDVIGKYPIEKKGNIKDELLRVTRHLDPFEDVYITGVSKKTGKPTKKQDAYTAYRRSRSELFAQYIRMYVGDPVKARELAPGFTGIVEREIAKDKEFKYIITKLREFEAEFKPVKDFVSALPPIKEMAMAIKNWEAEKNPLTMLWRNKVGDVLWNKIVDKGERVSKLPFLRELVEKKGLSNAVFELLRQRKLLIQGQSARVDEELIAPTMKKLSKEEQEAMASNLQDWSTRKDVPAGDLEVLTEKARGELAVWGNELRKLGLLNDSIFWNMTGQYLPFMYSTKEFDANKAAFGFFPTKAIRANLSGLKHKLTNEEFGRKVLEAQLGTWPASQAKIDKYSAEELAQIGINAREELGLIKTAAYPLQKRISQMIESVYTIKTFNMMAKIPGIIGNKTTPNYAKMPEAKKFGAMAGQYVPENLVREVGEWAIKPTDIEKFFTAVISGWKVLKVPMNTAAVGRNIITNIITSWMGDVPLQNPLVLGKGLSSFTKTDKFYTQLRDVGLFHNTYSVEELQGLAFIAPDDPNFMQKVMEVASKVFNAPGRLYGFIEDLNKLSIGRYVIEHGGSAEEAVKKANSLLFDYSSVSRAVGLARKFPFPMVTWSAKIFPRLIETAIRRPEKYIILLAAIAGASAYARYKLGITQEEEEKAKPDKFRGKTSVLMGERDKWGRLQWFDLSWLLPWEGFNPVKNGKVAAPQVLQAGNPFLTFYNAYILNYDPFYGEIAPEYLPEGERTRLQQQYLWRSLGPQLATTGMPRIYESATVPEKKYDPKLLNVVAGELAGLRVVPEEREKKIMLKNIEKYNKSKGIGAVNRLEKKGIITKEQEKQYKNELREKYREYRKTH